MAYKYSVGNRQFGDIEYENDSNTEIDFENDYIFMNLRIKQSAKMGIFFSHQLNDLALCILNHLLFFLLSACFESIYY